ncbi:MAG: transporter substrate-binding domain-containing protein [Eggerthellaceae bacterium]|nr:transporter substrate-binding domain-containing protein [Eggerthellaceae bacterium]
MIKRFGMLLLSVMLGLGMLSVLTGCNTEEYTPQDKQPIVFAPTIAKNGVLRVGVDIENSPFAGKPADTIIGLNVDIAAALADELGLKLELVSVGTDYDAALAADNPNRVDIVMGVDKADTAITCWRSEAYIQSGVALFAMSPEVMVPTQDSAARIAAQSSSMSAWEVNKQYGEESLVSSPDLKTVFSDLANGSVSYAAADAVIGTYAAYSSSPRVNVSIIALLQKPNGYAVGVLEENTELKQIISDVLVKLTSNGVIDLVEVKWLGNPIDLTGVPFTEGVVTQETPPPPPAPEPEPADDEEDEGDDEWDDEDDEW